MQRFETTERSTVKRLPKRGDYSLKTVFEILDAGFLCHVGFVTEGQPFVIPTSYGRSDKSLFIHGSAASRMLRSLATKVDVCVTVTLLDGLVLARSAFHHSMNYRSVVVFGTANLVEDPDRKLAALEVISENIVRGRWADVRGPNAQELKATHVLELPIEEASAKIRVGPPLDDEADYELPVWAGVLPVRSLLDEPLEDSRLRPGTPRPEYLRNTGKFRS